MRIALASQNRETLTPHAGRCRHFFLFDSADPGSMHSLSLAPGELLSLWQVQDEHPLLGVDCVVATSMGEGVAEKLAQRGIRGVVTRVRDLRAVLNGLVDGSLPLGTLRAPRQGFCGTVLASNKEVS